MTSPTKAIAPILLEDMRKVAVERKGETNFFTSQMIKDCMKKVIAVSLHEVVQVDDELEIKPLLRWPRPRRRHVPGQGGIPVPGLHRGLQHDAGSASGRGLDRQVPAGSPDHGVHLCHDDSGLEAMPGKGFSQKGPRLRGEGYDDLIALNFFSPNFYSHSVQCEHVEKCINSKAR